MNNNATQLDALPGAYKMLFQDRNEKGGTEQPHKGGMSVAISVPTVKVSEV